MAKIQNATNRYLDKLALAMGDGGPPVSDYRLAHLLAVSTSQISNYRNRGGGFDNKTAIKVAELLMRDPMEVIASVEWDRAKSDKDKDFWVTRVGDKVAGIALAPWLALVSCPGVACPARLTKN